MTPLSFEWQWDVEYIIFFGFLYAVLIVAGCGFFFALVKTVLQFLGIVRERHP